MVNKYSKIIFRYVLLLFFCLVAHGCNKPDDAIKAARFNDLKSLVKILDSGVQVDHADPSGETALFHIIGSGSQKGFDLLMKRGASAQLRDEQGNTTLHKAATFSRSNFANSLISFGVEVNSTNKVGDTPLHYAVINGDKFFVEVLIKNGADKNILNIKKESVINIIESMLNQDLLTDSLGKKISKNTILSIEKILKQ